jgi:multiple antibiotic resistance protein
MEATLSTFAATLFALLNPLGMLPVFIGYTEGLSSGVQRWLALLVTLTVLGLMILSLLTGNNILNFIGITLEAFRMAGGIILLLIGIRTVNEVASHKTNGSVAEGVDGDLGKAGSVYRMIVVPFAMPLLVGPGVIANLILHAAEAKNGGHQEMFLGLVAVILDVSLLTFLILLSARPLQRMLGEVGLSIVTRILGLLVAAIGMQFVVSGTTDTIVHVIAPAILRLH